jgi:acetolactate synthase-1/2/3 large subunit
MTVKEVILRILKEHRVRVVFGIPGGAIIPLLELLSTDEQIDFFMSRHDAGSAYMADGYARVTGKLGVCLATSGPGATNAITGVLCAHMDGSPLLMITGDINENWVGKWAFQELDVHGFNLNELFKNACAASIRLTDPAKIPAQLNDTIEHAFSVPRKAVHISVPVNVFNKTGCSFDHGSVKPPENKPFLENAGALIRKLSEAHKPTILLGSGASLALLDSGRLEKFKTFVDRYQIPILTSPKAKGIFPESSLYGLGNIGMAAGNWANAWLNGQDGLGAPDMFVIVGCSLSEWTTNSWSLHLKDAYVVQVDADPRSLGRNYKADEGIAGDAAWFLDSLLRASEKIPLSKEFRRNGIIRIMKEKIAPFDHAVSTRQQAKIHPIELMIALQTRLEGPCHVFVDVGNCLGWTWHCLKIDPPVRIFYPTNLGPMGWSMGASIGGKLGAPAIPSLAIMGDGAYLMNSMDLLSAVERRVGVVWIVLQDNDYSMVSQLMKVICATEMDWQHLYRLGAPDLSGHAKSLGANARTISSIGDFTETLDNFLSLATSEGKPGVIVVPIDTDAAPSYNPMRIGNV